jgi:hypothetical protein
LISRVKRREEMKNLLSRYYSKGIFAIALLMTMVICQVGGTASFTLHWTNHGDDGNIGRAAKNEIYIFQPIVRGLLLIQETAFLFLAFRHLPTREPASLSL